MEKDTIRDRYSKTSIASSRHIFFTFAGAIAPPIAITLKYVILN
jgi:hypothetical protein